MKKMQELTKKENLMVFFLIGLLILTVNLPVKGKKEEKLAEKENIQESKEQEGVWEKQMEQRLMQMLEKVDRIGRTEVFLTCENTGKKMVEKDETDTVYEKDSKGNQIPYVNQETYPKVTGVLVVAEGGDNPIVIQNIQDAVYALFQVEPHKIKVMKMNERKVSHEENFKEKSGYYYSTCNYDRCSWVH